MAAANFDRRLNEILLGVPYPMLRNLRESALDELDNIIEAIGQSDRRDNETNNLINEACDRLLQAVEKEAEALRPPPIRAQIHTLGARLNASFKARQSSLPPRQSTQGAERTPRPNPFCEVPLSVPSQNIMSGLATIPNEGAPTHPIQVEPLTQNDNAGDRRSLSVVPSSRPARYTR